MDGRKRKRIWGGCKLKKKGGRREKKWGVNWIEGVKRRMKINVKIGSKI